MTMVIARTGQSQQMKALISRTNADKWYTTVHQLQLRFRAFATLFQPIRLPLIHSGLWDITPTGGCGR